MLNAQTKQCFDFTNNYCSYNLTTPLIDDDSILVSDDIGYGNRNDSWQDVEYNGDMLDGAPDLHDQGWLYRRLARHIKI